MNEILTYVITGCCGCGFIITGFWILFFMGAAMNNKEMDMLHSCPQCGSPCICDMHEYRCWCNKCVHWNDVQE